VSAARLSIETPALDPVDIGVMNGELVERDGLRRGEGDFG
jgi:hypothetical protein